MIATILAYIFTGLIAIVLVVIIIGMLFKALDTWIDNIVERY